MDLGHYNCRDYHITPHFAAATLTNEHDRPPSLPAFQRHESFDELEQRSRSPSSQQPKFPLLRLPLELRQQIFAYLLPRTLETTTPNPLAYHARNFSAVQKRVAKGMPLPVRNIQDCSSKTAGAPTATTHIVWQRGNIKLLSVCRQLHDECAALLYGDNTFLLFVTYGGIVFRYSWLLPSGLNPTKRYPFLELMPARYCRLLKRLIIRIEHVDSYTGMIKFNVSGKGLVHGLTRQIARLVDALDSADGDDSGKAGEPVPAAVEAAQAPVGQEESGFLPRRLTKVHIRISTANSIVDEMKRMREGGADASPLVEDLDEMLEPFAQLYGVRDVAITGAVTDELAARLKTSMTATQGRVGAVPRRRSYTDLVPAPQLCVYGNDI